MKLLSIITLSLGIIMVSCQNDVKQENRNDAQIETKTTNSSYLIYLNEMAKADSARKEFLKKIDEVEIENKQVESYRLEWSRAFHGPMMYTIEEKNKEYTLKVISIDRKMTVTKLKESDWNEFKARLREANFWNIDEGKNEGKGMLDGSYWTLEGKIPATDTSYAKYHIVTRFTPRESAFKTACLKLIKLGPEIEKQDIY